MTAERAERRTAPYGSWPSPITAGLIAQGAIPLGQVELDGSDVYWLEGRPTEGGRSVIMRRAADGTVTQVTPAGFNVRTRVHEYGGGAYVVHQGTLYFSNFADQRLYRQDRDAEPRPITSEPTLPGGDRYADARVAPGGSWLVCVRERHTGGAEAVNEVVAVRTDGLSEPTVLATGHNFYSNPRLSPDGTRLCWLSWDHPNMPWDGTELWMADVVDDGASVANPRQVAGGRAESVFQPEWGADGWLYFVTDPSGWWNLYRWRDGQTEALAPMAAEFGAPLWNFGFATYTFLGDGRLACAYLQDGITHLATLDPETKQLQPLDLPFTSFGSLRSDGQGHLAFGAGSATRPSAVATLDVTSGQARTLKSSFEQPLDERYLSPARPITFPTENGLEAHALFYAPVNPGVQPPAGERPPLLVLSHGGPTSAASGSLSLGIQFWTSRGIAVVDVNYGGSTGYGRAYRERLNDNWGLVDVADCANAARYLAEQGEVDGQRLAIRGGSAGGYTTLAALTFKPGVFSAGASYFGVADLETLATDTHKFESRYLDTLVGPYPAAKAIYEARSPIHHTDRLNCPIILFQGLEDKVVPPAQAESMAAALDAKGLPYAYLPFEGEQHGFRRAETIQRTLEAELYFYGRIFGFQPADEIEPVEIQNL